LPAKRAAVVQHVQGGFRRSLHVSESLFPEEEFVFRLPFPAQQAVYDNVQLLLDDKPLALTFSGSQAVARTRLTPGAKSVLKAAYRSHGLDNWKYTFSRENADGGGKEVSQARDFHLLVKTDFSGFDFPDNSLSPTEKRQTANGWELEWNYQNLVSGFDIALKMPQKLQPGPLAGRISYFAPVSLFFFFFLVFMLSTLRGNDLHAMNYFFLACAFFAFHLLLAYLADHISIHAAFCDFVGGLDCAGGQLLAAGGGLAVRGGGCGTDATDLSGALFVCVFLRRVYGVGGDDWGDPHAICGDADDRADSVGGEAKFAAATQGRHAGVGALMKSP